MDEKSLKYNKRIILLRWILPVLLVSLMAGFLAPSASAYEIWNVYDNISDIVLNGDIATLTVKLPVDDCEWAFNDNGNLSYYKGQNVHHYVTAGQSFNLYFNPFGPVHSQTPKQGVFFRDHMLSFEDLPEDATFSQSLNIGVSNGANVSWHSVRSSIYYASNKNEYLSMTDFGRTVEWDSEAFVLRIRSDNVPIDTSEGAGFHTQMFVASLVLPYTGSTNFAYQFSISFNLSKAYFDYVSSGRYSQMLDAIESQLYLNGKTLGEIVSQQTQTNKTLEQIVDQQQQTNDKLDELPGEIGDEMQEVIDKENEKHESEGNKFVDQLLDILPDPSQDVLAALGSLAGATGYTGTDAVLSIPAIVLPGISGLFPETVIWGGDQLDFGEYLDVLPSSLLTLVQSLFTIAIVLFCVFELKGIISYCLTLRSGKGG